jgi:hypothetical protein
VRPLSIWDRIVFGSIAALVGGVLGLLAAVLGAVAFDSPPAWRTVLTFSLVFFFCVGAARGPDAGFLMGEALSAIGGIGAAEAGVALGDTEGHDKPRSWRSAWLLGTWLAVVAVLTWRA